MALLRENRMLAVTDRLDQASSRRTFSDSVQLYNKKFDKLFSSSQRCDTDLLW